MIKITLMSSGEEFTHNFNSLSEANEWISSFPQAEKVTYEFLT